MMGANMGYVPGPKLPWIKKGFAWLPVGTNSGKTMWLKPFWEVTLRDPESFEVKVITMNEKEFFLWTMANQQYESKAKRKKAIAYYSQF